MFYYRNGFPFLGIFSMCKRRLITHKLNEARRAQRTLYKVCKGFAGLSHRWNPQKRNFLSYNYYFVHLKGLFVFAALSSGLQSVYSGRVDSVEKTLSHKQPAKFNVIWKYKLLWLCLLFLIFFFFFLPETSETL